LRSGEMTSGPATIPRQWGRRGVAVPSSVSISGGAGQIRRRPRWRHRRRRARRGPRRRGRGHAGVGLGTGAVPHHGRRPAERRRHAPRRRHHRTAAWRPSPSPWGHVASVAVTRRHRPPGSLAALDTGSLQTNLDNQQAALDQASSPCKTGRRGRPGATRSFTMTGR
jgi:hypothetical protein